MNKELEVLARGVCIKEGKILVCQTKGDKNTYLPGGHVEFEETVKEALRREIDEELGVDSTVGRFLGAVEHTFDQKGEVHCEINLLFELSCEALDISRSPESQEEYIEFHWVVIEDLATFKLEPAVLIEKLPQWLAKKGDNWGSSNNLHPSFI